MFVSMEIGMVAIVGSSVIQCFDAFVLKSYVVSPNCIHNVLTAEICI